MRVPYEKIQETELSFKSHSYAHLRQHHLGGGGEAEDNDDDETAYSKETVTVSDADPSLILDLTPYMNESVFTIQDT